MITRQTMTKADIRVLNRWCKVVNIAKKSLHGERAKNWAKVLPPMGLNPDPFDHYTNAPLTELSQHLVVRIFGTFIKSCSIEL